MSASCDHCLSDGVNPRSTAIGTASASSLVLPFFDIHELGKYLAHQNSQTHLSLICLEVA